LGYHLFISLIVYSYKHVNSDMSLLNVFPWTSEMWKKWIRLYDFH